MFCVYFDLIHLCGKLTVDACRLANTWMDISHLVCAEQPALRL